MGNSIKKIVQNVLLYPRKSKYDKEYLLLMERYDRQKKETAEKIQEENFKKESSSKVSVITMGELCDNVEFVNTVQDDKFYIVYQDSLGIISSECERVVFEFVSSNPYALVCYGDEDYFAFCNSNGEMIKSSPSKHFNRFFKPQYSPDTLVSMDYMGLIAIKGDILREALNKKTEDALEKALYEMTFNACAIAINRAGEQSIVRIPRVLSSKGIKTSEESLNLISKHGRAASILADELKTLKENCTSDEYKEVREKGKAILGINQAEKNVSVSVIIPSKDNPDMLMKCIKGLGLEKNSDIEIIVVDNGSNEDNKKAIEEFLSSCQFDNKYIYEPAEFNYSHMNNLGVKNAKGEVVLLLNDDIEADGHKWIKSIANHAIRADIGCVGCKLLYPNGLIQHVGIACGVDGPAHEFMGEEDKSYIGHGENIYNKNVLAVTGACLAVRKSLYEEIGGLCEELKVGYNDVDFCLSLSEKGYRNLLLNDIVLVHHESVSRGKDAKSQAKSSRLKKEREILVSRHKEYMISDPYKGGTKDFELAIEDSASLRNEVELITNQTRTSNDNEGWVYTCFEELEFNIEDKEFITRGFALVPGIDNMRFDFDMVLEKDEKQYIIPLRRVLRTDLSGRFNGTDNTELCGFNQKTLIELPSGEYSIKIYAKDHGNVREIITDTGRSLMV